MIEMDMALETELGVDSIKRVEILSDVQKGSTWRRRTGCARAHPDGEVVEAMIAELRNVGGGGSVLPWHPQPRERRRRRRRRLGVSAEATRVVLAVLAAKTGYEPDMIEMDMALRRSWASTRSSASRS